VIDHRICPMCHAAVRVDLAQATADCAACSARFVPVTAEAVRALETRSATVLKRDDRRRSDPEDSRRTWNAGVLGGIVIYGGLYGAIALGVTSTWVIVITPAAVAGLVVWHVRRSRRRALPDATALRRDHRRALRPSE
jgi:hypothetical protein